MPSLAVKVAVAGVGGRARSPPPLSASCSGGVRGGGLPLFPAPRPSPKCPRPPRRCESGSALPPLGRVGRGGRGSGRVALPAPTCACGDQTTDVEKDEKKLSDMEELILLRPLNTVQSTRKTDSTPVPRVGRAGWAPRRGSPSPTAHRTRSPPLTRCPFTHPSTLLQPLFPTVPPIFPPPFPPLYLPPSPPFFPSLSRHSATSAAFPAPSPAPWTPSSLWRARCMSSLSTLPACCVAAPSLTFGV